MFIKSVYKHSLCSHFNCSKIKFNQKLLTYCKGLRIERHRFTISNRDTLRMIDIGCVLFLLMALRFFSEFSPCSGTVLVLRTSKQFVDSIEAGQQCGVILDQTNFYAESGGQTYDTGFMTCETNEVND